MLFETVEGGDVLVAEGGEQLGLPLEPRQPKSSILTRHERREAP